MKALSLRQPWANAVLYLGKNIENRKWNTKFRGEFLIHAAKGMTIAEWEDAIEFCNDVLAETDKHSPPMPMMRYADMAIMRRERCVRGGIVGRARVVDVIEPCKAGRFGKCDHAWHMPKQRGFMLADVMPLPFVEWPGSLGFFNVPFDRDGRRAKQ